MNTEIEKKIDFSIYQQNFGNKNYLKNKEKTSELENKQFWSMLNN